MNGPESVSCVTRRIAMATALLAVLCTAGCMTGHQAVTTSIGDAANTAAAASDPEGAECSQFACEQ